MTEVKTLNDVSAEAYAKAGTWALKQFGVHHLSKSSGDSLLECANKFHFKSRFRLAKPALMLGTICHSVLEHAADALTGFTEGKPMLRSDMTEFQKFLKEYEAYKDEVLGKLDLSRLLTDAADNELMSIAASQTEVLYPEGVTHSDLRNEIFATVETMAKSLTKEHLGKLLEHPVVGAELPVVYMPGEHKIPYLGYIDLLKIGPDGKLRICDLKTTFSNNQAIWSSMMTKFQLWLYGKSLVQMGVTPYMPEVEISRMIIDLGTRRKVKPSSYKITIERGVLPDIEQYDRQFEDVMRYAEKLVSGNVQIFAHSQYGCASCDYKAVCDRAVTSDDWKIEGKEADDESSL